MAPAGSARFAIALLLTILHWSNANHAPAFEVGKKYTYSYEAVLATGVSDEQGKQFSASGVRANLLVQNYGDGHVTFQLADVTSGHFAHDHVDATTQDFQLSYEENPDERHWTSSFIQTLESVFVAKFDNGLIKSMKFEELEERDGDSVSFRNAIASLFQLNLKKVQDDETVGRYTVAEDGVGGKCAITYEIGHPPPATSSPRASATGRMFTVHKTRHYDKCESRLHYFHSTINGYKCPNDQDNTTPYETSAEVIYKILGGPQKYIIDKISATGLTKLSMFGEEGQIITQVSNQTVVLINVEDNKQQKMPVATRSYVTKNVSEINEYRRADPDADLKAVHLFSPRQISGQPANLSNIVSEIEDELVSFAKQDLHSKHTTIDNILVSSRYMTYDDFTQLYTSFVGLEKKNAVQNRAILTAFLPLVGTNPSVTFVLHLIEKKMVPEIIMGNMIRELPLNVRTPSAKLTAMFWKFLNGKTVKSIKSVQQSSWLAFGTLLYRGCVKTEFSPRSSFEETHLDAATCTNYVQKMMEQFYYSRSVEQKGTILRAVKNAHYDTTFAWFLSLITQKGLDVSLRRIAIAATVHFGRSDPQIYQVMPTLLPILKDFTNDPLLRISAFQAVLQTEPSKVFFKKVAEYLKSEPNRKVASYISSSIQSLANSTDPCHRDISVLAKHALQYIEVKDYDILKHGHSEYLSYFSEKFKYGSNNHMYVIGSDNTAVPREFYVSNSYNFMGYNIDDFEGGLEMSNYFALDNALATLLSGANLPTIDHSASTRHYGQRSILSNARELFSDAVRASYAYMGAFGQQVWTKNGTDTPEPDTESVSFHYQHPKPNMQIDLNYHTLSSSRLEYVVPNELGLSTYLSMDMYFHLPVHGKLIIYLLDRSVEYQGSTGFTYASFEGLQVRSPVLTQGISSHSHLSVDLPLNLSAAVKPEEPLRLRFNVPPEPRDILLYQSELSLLNNKQLVPVKYNDRNPADFSFGSDYCGVETSVTVGDLTQLLTLVTNIQYAKAMEADSDELGVILLDGLLDPKFAQQNEFSIRMGQTSLMHPATSYEVDLSRKQGKLTEKGGSTPYIYDATVRAVGPTPREWAARWEYQTEYPSEEKSSYVFRLKQSPIPEFYEEEVNVFLKLNYSIVGMPSLFTDLLNVERKPQLLLDGQFTLEGSHVGPKIEMNFTGVGERSSQQEMVPVDELPSFSDCKNDRSKGEHFSHSCRELAKEMSKLDKFSMTYNFKKTGKREKTESELRLYGMRKDEVTRGSIVVDYLPDGPIVHVIIVTPDNQEIRKTVPISALPKNQRNTISLVELGMDTDWESDHTPVCFFSGHKIRTFDNVTYEYPLNSAYHVAYTDCPDQFLAVSVKDVDSSKYKKAVHVGLQDQEIEIRDSGNGVLSVVVDKMPVLRKDKVYFYEEPGKYTFAVSRLHDWVYVDLSDFMLEVFTDGNNVVIKTTDFAKRSQCGLCGRFDGESLNEFTGPDGTVYEDAEEFGRSYALN